MLCVRQIALLVCIGLVYSIELKSEFEDITSSNEYDLFPTPSTLPETTTESLPSTTPFASLSTKARKSMKHYLSRKHFDKSEKLQDLRLEQDHDSRGAYAVQPRKVSRDEGQTKQVVAGVPDLSDPCFRRYSNCIVVNAQPYERRSNTGLMHCKSHCLHSQTGVYSCRAFVYDNVNQVCDLFAHVGDQSPARLLKFQTRDYFEPTSAVQCLDRITSERPREIETQWPARSTTTTTTTKRTTTTTEEPEEDIEQVVIPFNAQKKVALASNIDERNEANKVDVNESNDILVEQKSDPEDDVLYGTPCPRGKKVSFLRTQGFELFNNNDIVLPVRDVSECTTACERNKISGRQLDCKSFDHSDDTCYFTTEAAVPVGNGQLKQKADSYYYEKICVSEQYTQSCPASFDRFPQMILVGFAESVSDSASFEHCFDSCLNSFSLFGFNCTSGMYYFEESKLNCILNSEDRHTQKDLFAEENTDIVDYFEVGCDRTTPVSRALAAKNIESFPLQTENLVMASETQTEWSECDEGVQHRRRDCRHPDKANCGMESRQCVPERKGKRTRTTTESTILPTRSDIDRLKDVLSKSSSPPCPLGKCCPMFGGCDVGIRQSSDTRQLEWCKNPCDKKRRRRT